MIKASSEQDLKLQIESALNSLGVTEPITLFKKRLFRVDVTKRFGGLIDKFHNASYGKNVGKFYIAIPIQEISGKYVAHSMTLFTGDVYDKLSAIARYEF